MRILVLLTPDFNIAATMAFIDPFRAANYLEGEAHFRWKLATPEGSTCTASNGVTVTTEAMSNCDEGFDLVVVSSSWAPERYSDKPMLSLLRGFAHSGAVMAGLDTGAFLLAAAGLLSGKRATVHYEHIDAMIELHDDVEVCEDLFVFDGNRYTCCGGSASADFAFHIIRRHAGDMLANMAARYVFHQNIRPENAQQNPGSIEPLGNAAPLRVREAIAMMEGHLEDIVSIEDICARLGVSRRQLDRLFVSHAGKTPYMYYRDIRLDRARGLLTQTDMPIGTIAIASGFAGQAQFTRAYRQRFSVSPSRDRVEGRIPFEYRAWPLYRKPLHKSHQAQMSEFVKQTADDAK